MRPNFLWGLFWLMSRHECVHVGPVLVSACESAAGFQMVAVLAALQKRSDPFSASLSALVWSGDLLEDFGGICCGVQQIFHKCFMSDVDTTVSTAILN